MHSELAAADRYKSQKEVKVARGFPAWKFFPRKIHSQRHRGVFRRVCPTREGSSGENRILAEAMVGRAHVCTERQGISMCTHRAFRPIATAEKWLRRLLYAGPENYSLRRYDDEQWDVMFFLQGRVEMILCDVRAGFSKRIMRFFIDGDNHRSSNNVGVVVPPGVAHAIRVEGAEDVIMVYGTSTIFHPEFEGRIASEIENAELPESWQKFLGRGRLTPELSRAVQVNLSSLSIIS